MQGQDNGISEQMAAASTLIMLPLCKNTRCHKWKGALFAILLGVNLGNINSILLNQTLSAYFIVLKLIFKACMPQEFVQLKILKCPF